LANQRALLRYFGKYHEAGRDGPLAGAAARIEGNRSACTSLDFERDDWRSRLLGLEGDGSAAYFGALREAGLFAPSFERRMGRGATEVVNAGLNLGYTLLMTRVWSALVNAGLECFAGVLHQDRPGKPSLALDIMEEYRPFVVDRTIVTLRQNMESADSLDAKLRRRIISDIGDVFERRILHRGRKLRLQTVLQRQAYRLAGHFAGEQAYRPVRFSW
jgi:CRISPR-associated protein Cas1